jgi:hypothetical protein
VTPTVRPVRLEGLPSHLFEQAVTYLGDTLRECQLVLVDRDQGRTDDASLLVLAEALVPDLEELRDVVRAAEVVIDGDRVRIDVDMRIEHAATIAHLQMQLVQLRLLGRRGSLLVESDPDVTQLLAWVWDEAADQIHGRTPRPYRRA